MSTTDIFYFHFSAGSHDAEPYLTAVSQGKGRERGKKDSTDKGCLKNKILTNNAQTKRSHIQSNTPTYPTRVHETAQFEDVQQISVLAKFDVDRPSRSLVIVHRRLP